MTRTLERPPTAAARDDARWDAVVARDAAFDGQFYYSVATTGVYCRPSCAARLAKRSNVRFHATRADAERAGFRPCKRCKPDQPPLDGQHAGKVAQACRLIETAEEAPTLGALADAVGLSPYHFHRIFKAALGVTPKAYATAHRHKRVREQLGRSETVTEAIYEFGFNSNGRFYATASELLGMTPSDFRAGGARPERAICHRRMLARARFWSRRAGKASAPSCSVTIPKPCSASCRTSFRRAELIGGDRAFEKLTAKVIAFVERPGLGLDLPLDVQGTAFQHRVWDALAPHPGRLHRELRGDRGQDRRAESGAGRGAGLRLKPDRRGHSLPPRGAGATALFPAIAGA